MAGDQCGRLQAGAAVGHVGEIEVELLVQLKAEEMRRRARLVRRIAELALVCLRPFQELGEGLGRHVRMRHEHQRRLDATDERHEIVDRPAQVLECIGIDLGERLGADPDHLPVGRLLERCSCAEMLPSAPGRLSTMMVWSSALRHALGDDARVGVDRAARRGADDEPDGAGSALARRPAPETAMTATMAANQDSNAAWVPPARERA